MKAFCAGLMLIGSLCGVAAVQAEVPAALVNDFKPVDGLVLLARDGEILVDAPAEKGVRVGELFSIVIPGVSVRHPVSGEVIGRLDKVGGVLAITQVYSGFSTARQLSGTVPEPGALIRRFERVKTWFVDPAGTGEGVFSEIRAALPQLDWQPYTAEAGTPGKDGLQFILRGSTLEARAAGELLHSYTWPASAALLTAPPGAAPVPVVPLGMAPPPVKTAPVVAAPLGATVVVPQTAQAVDRQPSKWLGAAVNLVPVGLVVADLDGDGRLEIARAFDRSLEIGRLVGSQYEKLQEFELVNGREGMSLVAYDLNGNGRPEIFFSAVSGEDVRSTVYEFNDNKYRQIADNQRWFINVVNLDDGKALLGQRRTLGLNPFSDPVYRLKWQGTELSESTQVKLPPRAKVYGISIFPPAGIDRFVRINDAGRIALSSFDATDLWVSDVAGDSEIGFNQSEFVSTGGEDRGRYFYLPVPFYVADDGLLITAMNTGFTGTAMFRQMTGAQIIGWRWEGFELMQKWRIADIEGYVPALTIADADNDGTDELVMLLTYPNENPFASRRSVIRLLSMN